MAFKIQARGEIATSFAPSEVTIDLQTAGRFKGRFFVRGGGFAGKTAYRTMERARQVAESHARFARWIE